MVLGGSRGLWVYGLIWKIYSPPGESYYLNVFFCCDTKRDIRSFIKSMIV